ncbi:MAG: hypothetical protein GX340_09470 [Clostridiales bacterium]|nr:hypothetical protein [Clostridiales bacterium]
MKDIYILKIIPLVIVCTLLISLLGCSNGINGSDILSDKNLRDQDIMAMDIVIYNTDNRLEYSTISLTNESESGQAGIQEFYNIIKKAKGFTIDDEENFSPITDSSHLIQVIYDNGQVLDFYYSADLDWIIWSDITEEDGSKIVEYHFLSPKGSMKDWLSSL